MRKVILAITLITLAAPLGGCFETFQAITGGLDLATKSIANPVTPAQEAQIEVALGGAVGLLRTYKQACVEGRADVNCQTNIAQVQIYTIKVKPLVVRLRSFVDNNDQINASVVYNELKALYIDMKATAAQLGINLGSSTI